MLHRCAAQILLLLSILAAFVPLSPKMPAPGLDPSWAMGLNQAVAQGLAFGRDIIFTLGPYSSVYTKTYHPKTDFMMMVASFYLACSYWLAMILFMRTVFWPWILVFSLFFLGMLYARDSLFFSYPLLVGLIHYQVITAEASSLIVSRYSLLLWIALFAPLGLLVEVKGSLLILCCAIISLCILFLLRHKKILYAGLGLSSFIGSMLICWLCAGQQLAYLPSYLLQTFFLAAGFSEAMAVDGNPYEIILYLGSSIFLLLAIFWQKQIPLRLRLFLFSIFFIFLFVSFKAGFTRHFGHSFIPATSILFAALLLTMFLANTLSWIVLIVSVWTGSYIIEQYTTVSLTHNVLSTLSPAWYGLKSRIIDKNWLAQNYRATMIFLREQASFPDLKGTTDIYSYAQTSLIASQNQWSPRPIFQSYSVFSPQLTEKNRRHLLGKEKPDNIIFKLEPIDNRLPSLEDGGSWPFILKNYQPVQILNDFLLLIKRDHLFSPNKLIVPFSSEKHYLDEEVSISAFDQTLFVKIEMTPTWLGSLATFLFKPSQLQIHFVLNDGTERQYRLIANMAKSGFLLSPLIESTAEFTSLYGKKTYLKSKMVKSFRISDNQKRLTQWKKDYIVFFNRLETHQA